MKTSSARGYGDDNPLFCDPAYGRYTRWGSQIAPPMIHIALANPTYGNPMAYDYAVMRQCWISHYLTDWVGDDGWVFSQHDEMRKFNYIGDAHVLTGEVVGKRVEDGRCFVDIALRATNQRGDVTAPGEAAVLLPSREHGPVVLPEPDDALKAKAVTMMQRHRAIEKQKHREALGE